MLKGSFVNELEYGSDAKAILLNTDKISKVMMEPVHQCSSKTPHQALRTPGRVSLTHSREAPQIILPLEQIHLFYKPVM